MKLTVLVTLAILIFTVPNVPAQLPVLPRLVNGLPTQLEAIKAPDLPIVATPKDLVNCYVNDLTTGSSRDPDIYRRMPELVSAHGYDVETHRVTTDDGYILKVFRISKKRNSRYKGKSILLSHALLGSSAQWFLQKPGGNLGMALADKGYDVWALNSRGTSYSSDHEYLTENDRAYWDFSFHEMGVYDVPAVIDHIISKTGEEKIYYVGHSQGSTMLFVMLSELPKYNDKIQAAFLLSPVAYLGHATTPVRQLTFLMYDGQYLSHPLLGGKIQADFLTKYLKTSIGDICSKAKLTCAVCNNLVYIVFGYDASQTDYDRSAVFFSKLPEPVATKSFVHYAQGATNNPQTFRQFDYSNSRANQKRYGRGVTTPPSYDLSKITTRIVGIYAENDNLGTPIDVKLTFSEMKNADKKLIKVPLRQFGHFDFANAKDAISLVYEHIFYEMED